MLTEKIDIINPHLLAERLKAIEDGINEIKANANLSSKKREWLTLKEFKEETGVKSHYYINKMRVIAKEKGSELKTNILGKRLFIHESEVKRYFDGFFQEK